MAWREGLVLGVLAAMALAGCAQAPVKHEAFDLAIPPPIVSTMPVNAKVYIGFGGGCSQVCLNGADFATILSAPPRANLTSVHLHLSNGDPVPESLIWELRCSVHAPGCGQPLAKGDQPLPFDIDLANLSLPAGADLQLQVLAPRTTPASDLALSVVRGYTRVTGTVGLLAPGVGPLENPVTVLHVSLDGISGPCVIVNEANCTDYPGGSRFDFQDLGLPVIAVNLTMTWSSGSALDEQIALQVVATSCASTCGQDISNEGPSPLVVATAGLQLGDLYIRPYHPTPDDLVERSYAGTRTAVHIEGDLFLQKPAVNQDG
jgi:hypothetical protein